MMVIHNFLEKKLSIILKNFNFIENVYMKNLSTKIKSAWSLEAHFYFFGEMIQSFNDVKQKKKLSESRY